MWTYVDAARQQLDADPRITSQRSRLMAEGMGYAGSKTVFDRERARTPHRRRTSSPPA